MDELGGLQRLKRSLTTQVICTEWPFDCHIFSTHSFGDCIRLLDVRSLWLTLREFIMQLHLDKYLFVWLTLKPPWRKRSGMKTSILWLWWCIGSVRTMHLGLFYNSLSPAQLPGYTSNGRFQLTTDFCCNVVHLVVLGCRNGESMIMFTRMCQHRSLDWRSYDRQQEDSEEEEFWDETDQPESSIW